MTSETHIQGHSRSCDARAQLRVVRYTGSSSRRTEVVTEGNATTYIWSTSVLLLTQYMAEDP